MVYLSLLAETPSASEPSIFPRDDDDLYPKERQDVGFFNYYFLLLGVLVVLIAVAIWLIHRRKVRHRALWRQNGQQALARDVEAWPGTRRLHGRCRATNSVLLRPPEGLNEHGEAPPPYQPKSEATSTILPIPLRILPAYESGRPLPPQYKALP
ncbi:hypothetical protein BKA58DRAFT_371306 [Alternaria rosae]|uniref:uncharacterized protein n=1 Tax=Alternaria rosae TaxID=1187941 RepID=UPI001E8D5E18|nr:uncharacterized protein BKA58DRAFT_371306 [Alternaria rosae]KAH6881281.1 hypothetical protein BKA58DRAFT_371306 [Alternaria rosae]